MRTLPRLLLIGLCVGAPVLAAGKEAGRSAPKDPLAEGLPLADRLQALIGRVRDAQRGMRNLEADFVQTKQTEFLASPEESRGEFSYLAPDFVRWEFVAPKPISLVIHGEEMITWYHDLARAEKVKVGRVSGQVFRYLNASGSIDALLDYFTMSFSMPAAGEPFHIELVPKYSRIAKRLAKMTLWIDRDRYLPVGVDYVEPNGDRTTYRFANLRTNIEMSTDRFQLKLPKEVELKTIDLGRGRAAMP